MTLRTNGGIKAAILEHQKECGEGLTQKLNDIWKAVREFSRHQELLANCEGTGKVDTLWKEREQRIAADHDRRKYYTRLVVGTLVVLLLTNMLSLFVFFDNVKALLLAHVGK